MLVFPLSPTHSLSISFFLALSLCIFRYFWFFYAFLSLCLLLYHITLLSTVTAVMWPLMTRKLCERRWHRQRLRQRQRQRYRCVCVFCSLVRFTFMYSCSFHASNRYHWVGFFPSPTSLCSFTLFFSSALHSISTQRVHLCRSFRQKLWHLNQ